MSTSVEKRSVEVVLKQETNDDEISVPIFSVFEKIGKNKGVWKRWVIAALIVSVLAAAVWVWVSAHRAVTAMVGFSYDGIEKGLDPNGNEFDISMLKSSAVVTPALESLGLDAKLAEAVRQNITIDGVVPKDAIDRIAMYKTMAEKDVQYYEQAQDVSYYATQYVVSLDCGGNVGLSFGRGRELLDAILESYGHWFYNTYGTVYALGAAVSTMDYSQYDYAETLDVIRSQLDKLSGYSSQLDSNDRTGFRSIKTGNTFKDIMTSVSTLEDVDMAKIESFVVANCLTKDKQRATTYYNYLIENGKRELTVAKDNYDSIVASIESYDRGTILVTGASDSDMLTMSQNSEEYDSLFEQKIAAANKISELQKNIDKYQMRVDTLNGYATITKYNEDGSPYTTKVAVDMTNNTPENRNAAEKELAALEGKISTLVDVMTITADEYYETVALSGSVSVLVQAKDNGPGLIDMAKKAAICVATGQALVFIFILVSAFFTVFIENSRRSRQKKHLADQTVGVSPADGSDEIPDEGGEV